MKPNAITILAPQFAVAAVPYAKAMTLTIFVEPIVRIIGLLQLTLAPIGLIELD
jgi:hypothetical protein